MNTEILAQGQFDRRVVERNIKKGLFTREAFDKFVKALPDVNENAEIVAARIGIDEEDDDDLEDEDDDEG